MKNLRLISSLPCVLFIVLETAQVSHATPMGQIIFSGFARFQINSANPSITFFNAPTNQRATDIEARYVGIIQGNTLITGLQAFGSPNPSTQTVLPKPFGNRSAIGFDIGPTASGILGSGVSPGDSFTVAFPGFIDNTSIDVRWSFDPPLDIPTPDPSTLEAPIVTSEGPFLGTEPFVAAVTVPEPPTLTLLATSYVSLLALGWRRRQPA